MPNLILSRLVKTLSNTFNVAAVMLKNIGGTLHIRNSNDTAYTGIVSKTSEVTDKNVFQEWSESGTPSADTLWQYAADVNGFTGLKTIDASSHIQDVYRDNIIVAKNNSGGTLNKLKPVRFSETGNELTFLACDNTVDTVEFLCQGVLMDNTADGAYGRVLISGILDNVNTLSLSAGSTLYLDVGTSANLTPYPPSGASGWIQTIGVVVKSDATTGIIQVFSSKNISPTDIYSNNINIGDSSTSNPTSIQAVTSTAWSILTFNSPGISNGGHAYTFQDTTGMILRDQAIQAKNIDVAIIPAFRPVVITNVDSGYPGIVRANASNYNNGYAHGITKSSITVGGTGIVYLSGIMTNVNTLAFSAGDVLYVDTSTGAFVNTPPTEGTGYSEIVGRVLVSHALAGSIFIYPEKQIDISTIYNTSGVQRFGAVSTAAPFDFKIFTSDGNVILRSNPTTDRTISLPDNDGTLALTTDIPTPPTDISGASYITSVSESNLSNEFALGSLSTGLLKNTTTTGIPTIAAAGTDYTSPSGTENLSNKTITISSLVATALSLILGGFKAIFTHSFTADHTVTIPGDADIELVGRTTSQILTGKTIDGDDNTIQDIALSSIKTAAANTKRFITRDASGVITDATSPAFDNAQHNHQNAAGGGQLDASNVFSTGQVPLARGGTNVDLSATGGTSQFLKQSSVGANISVGTIGTSDLPTIPISGGGTGQTTKTDGFDALSPTTTKGDVIVYNGSDNIRLPVGGNGDILTADSSQPSGLRWATPGSSISMKSVEIDFGTTSVYEKSFTITDGDVSAGNYIIAQQSSLAGTGKEQDENLLDFLTCNAIAGSGAFTLYARSTGGPVKGTFVLNYIIG